MREWEREKENKLKAKGEKKKEFGDTKRKKKFGDSEFFFRFSQHSCSISFSLMAIPPPPLVMAAAF